MSTVLVSASRDLPHLGWDPTPGDPDAVEVNAAELRTLGANLQDLASHLDISRGPRAWRGHAADAFCTAASALPQDTHTAGRCFEEVGQTLATWAQTLRDLQAETSALDRLMGDATAHLARRTAAAAPVLAELRDQLAPWSPTRSMTTSEYGEYGWTPAPLVTPTIADLPGYQTDPTIAAMNAAAQEVERLQHQAQDLHRRYLDQATRLARRIDAASAPAPATPHFRHQIGHWFSEQWDAWDDSGGQIVRNNAVVINRFTDTSGTVGIVSGVAAFIPPLIPAAGTVAFWSGVLSLSGNTFLALHADGSWTDAGLDATGIGLGAINSRITEKITDIYRSTGRANQLVNVRTITGDTIQVPPGLFSAKTMEGSEGAWRALQLKVTQASVGTTGIQADSFAHEYLLSPRTDNPWNTQGYEGTAVLTVDERESK